MITCVEKVLKHVVERNNRCSKAGWGRLIVSPILQLMSELNHLTANIEVLVTHYLGIPVAKLSLEQQSIYNHKSLLLLRQRNVQRRELITYSG
jgi:hypothetical protein